jgi:hypothetical protein
MASVLLMLGVGCDSDPRASLSTATATATVVSIANPAVAELAVWRGRIGGHTVDYLATISCARCETNGTYHFTERGGAVIDVIPIGSAPPLVNREQWSLTTVLEIAASAKGPVTTNVGSADGTITVSVDDFTYTAADITLT